VYNDITARSKTVLDPGYLYLRPRSDGLLMLTDRSVSTVSVSALAAHPSGALVHISSKI
jgi:hypothetical protein